MREFCTSGFVGGPGPVSAWGYPTSLWRMYLNDLADRLAVELSNRIKKRLKFPVNCLDPPAYSVRVDARV